MGKDKCAFDFIEVKTISIFFFLHSHVGSRGDIFPRISRRGSARVCT